MLSISRMARACWCALFLPSYSVRTYQGKVVVEAELGELLKVSYVD